MSDENKDQAGQEPTPQDAEVRVPKSKLAAFNEWQAQQEEQARYSERNAWINTVNARRRPIWAVGTNPTDALRNLAGNKNLGWGTPDIIAQRDSEQLDDPAHTVLPDYWETDFTTGDGSFHRVHGLYVDGGAVICGWK